MCAIRIRLVQDGADLCGDLLRVVAAGRVIGPDRPDRLVGDHQAAARQPLQLRDGRSQLAVDDRLRLTAPSLIGQLADGGDRHQPVPNRGGHLRSNGRIGLVVVLAALGVPEDHVLRQLSHHRW